MWWRQRAQERCIETRFVFAMVDLEHERPSANKKSTQSNGTLQLYYPIYTQPSNSIVKFNIEHSLIQSLRICFLSKKCFENTNDGKYSM